MEEYKKCPFCSEQILADAKKCRYCQTMLEEDRAAETAGSPPPVRGFAPPPAPPEAGNDLPPVKAPAAEEKKAYMPPPPVSGNAARQPHEQPVGKGRWKLPVIIVSAILLLIVILVIVAVSAGRSALRSSPIYTEALNYLNHNSEAMQYLGEPVEPGNVSGMVNVGEGIVEGDMEISVSGSLNKGTVYAEAGGSAESWFFTLLELEKEDGSRINLLTGSTAGLPEGFLLFAEPGYGFSIAYPQHWSYQFFSDNGVIFFGPEGTDEYDLELVVEIYYTSLAGGVYDSANEIASDLKQSISSMEGSISHEDSGRDIVSGTERDYSVFSGTYQRDGAPWGNTTLILQRDERLFYVIYYNAPAAIYSDYLDLIFDQVIGSFNFTDDLMY